MEEITNRFAPGVAESARLLQYLAERQLFFIGGSPKSGTTWLQLLLDKHPEMACAGETHFLDKFVPAVGKPVSDHTAYVEWVNDVIFTDLKCCPSLEGEHMITYLRVGLAFMLKPRMLDERVKAIGEKTPDNISHLPLMSRLFPESKFVQMVRDGRDCAVSGWHHNIRLSSTWLATHPIESYSLEFAKGWVDHLDAGRLFADTSPGRYYRVRYEDLSSCPRETLQGVFDFFGVDSGDAVVDECVEGASFESLSGGRRPGQEDAGSFFRKGSTGDWRNYFDKKTERAFNEIAGPWLKHLGYVQ